MRLSLLEKTQFVIIWAVAIILLIDYSVFAGPTANPAFDQAVANYKIAKYSQAAAQFEAINNTSVTPNSPAHYYLALCYTCLNQTAKAIQEYQWVTSYSRDPVLTRNAQIGLRNLDQYLAHRNYQGSSRPIHTSQSITSSNTQSHSMTSHGRPKVIDFFATWCGPCKRLSPILEEVESEYSGRVDFARMDVDAPENKAKVSQFGIHAMPTVVFLDGSDREIGRIVGLRDKTEYTTNIDKLLGR